MKNKILQTVLIAITAVLFSSCTRNNGDIGELFGQWKVVSITVNGENTPDYNGVMYFAFQSSVYCQKIVNEEAHWDDCVFAKWHYVESGIIIDFADTNYAPFPPSGMKQGENMVVIEKNDGKNMVMSYLSPDDVKYVYTLKKW